MTTHAELLKLTPERYLAGGYRDERGRARAELTALWAMAAAEQLRASGVTAAAFDALVAATTHAALHSSGPLGEAIASAPAPRAAQDLVRSCAAAVKSDDDRQPFAQHLGATLRLLALAESSQAFNAEQARRARPG